MEYFLLLIIIIAWILIVVKHKSQKFSDRYQIGYRKQLRSDYGYIYFYRGKGENPFYVKIGRTNSWSNRLKSARTSVSHQGLHIYGIVLVKDPVKAEKFVHDKFKNQRLTKKNEWFILSLGLWLYIRRIRNDKLTEEAIKELSI